MYHACITYVSRDRDVIQCINMYHVCITYVPRMYHVCITQYVSRMYQSCISTVSRCITVCIRLYHVSMYHSCISTVSATYQKVYHFGATRRCINAVSCVYQHRIRHDEHSVLQRTKTTRCCLLQVCQTSGRSNLSGRSRSGPIPPSSNSRS